MPEPKTTVFKAPPRRKTPSRKTAASKTTAVKRATAGGGTAKPVRKKKGLLHAVRTRVGKKKATGGFGGYRKRTMTTREFVNSMYSLVPEAHTIYQIWGKHELDAGFREELMLAVAKLNDCRYCSWGHHEWAHVSGIPEEELAHIENMDPAGFDRSKWVAISYVRAFVLAEDGRVDPQLLSELQLHHTAREIKEIEIVATVMDISNRGANTWDAMLSRLNGNPATDSHLLDELVLSSVFWTAAPIVVLYLSRASKRSFIATARSLIEYMKQYEESEQNAAA